MKEATLLKKTAQVSEMVEKINQSASAVFVNCIGLTVAQVTDLRTKLHAEGIELKVVKNNILRRAATIAGYSELEEVLVGPSAVALSKDATNASKIIFDFAKKNDKLTVKSGIVDGKVLNDKEMKILAKLPNKDGMLSMLLSVLQAPIRNLACAVKAVAEKEA